MRRCVTVLRRCRPGLVKSPTDYKVTETSAAETTPVGTASQSITVEDTSTKVPAVSAFTTSQCLMIGEDQSAGSQHSEANYHSIAREIPLVLQRRVTLDSSAVHVMGAIFKTSAVHHGHLLLGWCDAGPHSPISEGDSLGGAFIPRTRSTAGSLCRVQSASTLFAASQRWSGSLFDRWGRLRGLGGSSSRLE